MVGLGSLLQGADILAVGASSDHEEQKTAFALHLQHMQEQLSRMQSYLDRGWTSAAPGSMELPASSVPRKRQREMALAPDRERFQRRKESHAVE
jgi:hypothetical protein